MMSVIRGQRNLSFPASTVRYLVLWADAQISTDTTTFERQGVALRFYWFGRGPPDGMRTTHKFHS